jgi:hypothetical protein
LPVDVVAFHVFNASGVEINGHGLIEEADVREYVSYIGGSYEVNKGQSMSAMSRKIAGGHAGMGWFDDGMYDDYAGFTADPKRPHDRLLLDAMYAYWSRSDGIGYQYLADCYNEFGRKDGEPPLLPPPAYL